MATNSTPHQTADTQKDMTAQSTPTILSADPDTLHRTTDVELSDLFEQTSPDCIFVTGTTESVNSISRLSYHIGNNVPLLYPGSETDNTPSKGEFHTQVGDIDVFCCHSFNDLERVSKMEQNGTANPNTTTVILSNLLEIKMDMDNLETHLEGLTEYTNHFTEIGSGEYKHLVGTITNGYTRDWNELTITGAGNMENSGSKYETHSITPDGYTTTHSIKKSKLGLKTIQGVGPKTAERLRDEGYTSIESIADAEPQDLTDVNTVGINKAGTISKSARAFSNGEIIPTSTERVPGGEEPIYIDIETDGLNPTRVWLIGVLDTANDNYMSFIETDLDDNGQAIESFLMWYDTVGKGRTLLSWNGWNFDYPVIRKHLLNHCPQYIETWERASKRDLLRWARDFDNAILPGRTNKLETVAEALGWDGHNTGLDGAELARRFRNWMENPSDETELNWDRHKQYCEDDVRALKYIRDHMKQVERIDTNTDAEIEEKTPPSDEKTEQGSLFDSY